MDNGFLGYSKEPGSTDYITSMTITEDTVIYANYAVWEKTPEIKLTASHVQISDCSEGILIVAGYRGSTLVNVKMIDISQKASSSFEELGFDTSGCDRVCAFALKDFSSAKPVCGNKSIPL